VELGAPGKQASSAFGGVRAACQTEEAREPIHSFRFMAWAAIGISDSLITWKLKLAAAHVELVRVGRTPAELSREFNVIAQFITKWDGQADIDSTNPLPDLEGLSTAERELPSRRRHRAIDDRRKCATCRQVLGPCLLAATMRRRRNLRTRGGEPGRLARTSYTSVLASIRAYMAGAQVLFRCANDISALTTSALISEVSVQVTCPL
jgi:transposase